MEKLKDYWQEITALIITIISLAVPNPYSQIVLELINIIPDGILTTPVKPFLILIIGLIELLAIKEIIEKVEKLFNP